MRVWSLYNWCIIYEYAFINVSMILHNGRIGHWLCMYYGLLAVWWWICYASSMDEWCVDDRVMVIRSLYHVGLMHSWGCLDDPLSMPPAWYDYVADYGCAIIWQWVYDRRRMRSICGWVWLNDGSTMVRWCGDDGLIMRWRWLSYKLIMVEERRYNNLMMVWWWVDVSVVSVL